MSLELFLRSRRPVCREQVAWHSGQIRLQVDTYLDSLLPPLELVTSVRAVVLQPGQVLVVRNPDQTHIVPGGRREAREDLLETLARELVEETGWRCTDFHLLGFWHLHHLTPRPPGFRFPYPDFLHLIYAARAVARADIPAAAVPDEYELESAFLPLAEARRLPFEQRGLILLLDAALAAIE